MQNFYLKILSLFKKLAIVLILYVLMRNLMFLFNLNHFENTSFLQLLMLNFFGLRFDLAAILGTNAFLILLYLNPFRFSYSKTYQKILNIVFVAINGLSIIANLSDIIYFRFTLKRTTFEFFRMFSEDNNMFALIPTFIIDFWYITLTAIILILLFIYFARKTNYKSGQIKTLIQVKWQAMIISLLILGFTIIGIRGGTQLRPLSIIHASKYANNLELSLVLNTPFTLMKTIGKTTVPLKNYFTQEELSQQINTMHQYSDTTGFRPLNVVIIIMESMSKEHSGYFNPNLKDRSFTPFLDSLASKSWVCTQAFANGRKSIEGIPSILASFPTLFSDAFISSNYSSNHINSLASLLKTKGYQSSFYHGGNNGTMGFDNFVKSIGYQNYYGRTEYNDEADFDGKWGIFDEPYFQYFQRQLSQTSQPFLATIFSLSAHHPYTIPEQYKTLLPEGKLPIQKCIAYSDLALKKFFENASQQDWFANTLFVITADHTSEIADPEFNNPAGQYAIPILYYMPADSLVKTFDLTTQQADIMPSVLNYLHYDIPFYSIGNSVFSDSIYHEAIAFNNGVYQYISGDSIINFSGEEGEKMQAQALKNWPIIAPAKLQNLQGNNQKRLKSIIQKYNQDLVQDKMKY